MVYIMNFDRAYEIAPTINPKFMDDSDITGIIDACWHIRYRGGSTKESDLELAYHLYNSLEHLARRTTSEHYKEIIEAVMEQYIAVYNP